MVIVMVVLFFFTRLFCASSEESVVGLLAAGSLPQGGWDGAVQAGLAAAGASLASVPARIGEDLMQIGHGSFAQLGCGRQLEVWRRRRAGPQRRAVRTSAMAGEEAQELHCFGAKPAAGLDAHND